MNAFRHCHGEISRCIAELAHAGRLPAGLDIARVAVEPAYLAWDADVSTNAALVLAKPSGLTRSAIAELLAQALRGRPAVISVAIGGRGVVNWRLADSFWQARLGELMSAGTRYGDSDFGQGRPITIRCASADAIDAMRIDQARPAMIRRALANLLAKAGYTVRRDSSADNSEGPAGALAHAVHRLALRDIAEGIGRDVVRFIIMSRPPDQALDIDLVEAHDRSHDNPAWRVQHAHARVQSVLRHAVAEPGLADLGTRLLEADLALLADPAELALIRRLASWPRLIENAAAAREPHRVAIFLQDLASSFHCLWNQGKDDASLRFVAAGDPAATLARLALLQGVALVIESGLQIVGVEPVMEMR